MPKAARERVASPRAGTALAPQPDYACRTASVWARFEPDVTNSVTIVNGTVTRNFVILQVRAAQPRASKDERPRPSPFEGRSAATSG
jgi:hypothetical protein